MISKSHRLIFLYPIKNLEQIHLSAPKFHCLRFDELLSPAWLELICINAEVGLPNGSVKHFLKKKLFEINLLYVFLE